MTWLDATTRHDTGNAASEQWSMRECMELFDESKKNCCGSSSPEFKLPHPKDIPGRSRHAPEAKQLGGVYRPKNSFALNSSQLAPDDRSSTIFSLLFLPWHNDLGCYDIYSDLEPANVLNTYLYPNNLRARRELYLDLTADSAAPFPSRTFPQPLSELVFRLYPAINCALFYEHQGPPAIPLQARQA
ncbi:hypothetical protein V490_04764 [Pseudogymnoascus sp. VKM F-3557]|nr:hypothetical protein V490_04764 [Pseudogymnoascus sp. VKM F-3557]